MRVVLGTPTASGLSIQHDPTGQRRIDKNDRQQLTDVYHLQVEVQCLAGKGMVEIQKDGIVLDG